MAHVIDVRVECDDPFFWNYVYSDGHLMAERISPSWQSAALRPESDETEEAITEDGLVSEFCGDTMSLGYGAYLFSSRGFDTGLWRMYFLDVSRSCPDAEITLFEWFIDGHAVERVVLRDGRTLAHFRVTAESDFEIYANTVSLIFNAEVNPN